MLWVVFALGAVLAWGSYGPVLHRGQAYLGSPLRALFWVGVAYFRIGVLVPVVVLSAQGRLAAGFTVKGSLFAELAGARSGERGPSWKVLGRAVERLLLIELSMIAERSEGTARTRGAGLAERRQ